MSIALEAYTAEGLLTGAIVADGRLVDLLFSTSPITLDEAVVTPFAGAPERADRRCGVDVDDLIVIVATGDTVTPFHAVWHAIALDLGPYRVCGELPALPGFDPARALARPTGAFILLGRATVELRAGGLAAGINEHPFVWVNRYAVDMVTTALELGFFFPGAQRAPAQHAIA